jgi:hypothetical protein
MSFLLTLSLISAGCAVTTNPESQNAADPFHSRPPLNEMSAQHPPSLVIGSTFIYRDTNVSKGEVCKVAMTVKKMKTFETKPAYWIEVSREAENYFDIYDMNLNWIGSMVDGRELESAEPCIRTFDWPLRVGKTWKSNCTVKEYSGGTHLYHSTTGITIQRYEEVRVPAGTFGVLRIQAGEETFWYAPSLGWVVKEQIGPQDRGGWLLELVAYNIPTKIHPEKS